MICGLRHGAGGRKGPAALRRRIERWVFDGWILDPGTFGKGCSRREVEAAQKARRPKAG